MEKNLLEEGGRTCRGPLATLLCVINFLRGVEKAAFNSWECVLRARAQVEIFLLFDFGF